MNYRTDNETYTDFLYEMTPLKLAECMKQSLIYEYFKTLQVIFACHMINTLQLPGNETQSCFE